MLICKHSRRRQDRCLFAIHHGFERGAHRYFRLAVPNVSTQQTIHWRRRLHVALHIFDSGFLIRCEGVLKPFFEFALPGRVLRKRVSLNQLALGVQTQQLVCHIAHRPFGFGFCLVPAETAETIERRLVAFRAGVTLHEIQTLDRHVQFRVLGVVKQHELTAR